MLAARWTQDAAFSAAAELDLECSVGPTSDGGWTATWSSNDRALLDRLASGTPYVLVAGYPDDEGTGDDVADDDDAVDEQASLLIHRAGRTRRLAWVDWTLVSSDEDLDAVAAMLVAEFEPQLRASRFARRLRQGEDVDESIMASLAALRTFPDVRRPAPQAEILAHRGDLGDFEMVEAAASPALLGPASGGWHILVAAPDGGRLPGPEFDPFPIGPPRTDVRLRCWRQGATSGCRASQRWSSVELEWGSPWRHLPPRAPRALAGFETMLGPPRDRDAVRTLADPARDSGDPLADFLDLFGVPAEIVLALDHPDIWSAAPKVRRVERRPRVLGSRRLGVGPIAPAVLRVAAAAYSPTLVVVALLWVATLGLFAADWLTDSESMQGFTPEGLVAAGASLMVGACALMPAALTTTRFIAFKSLRPRRNQVARVAYALTAWISALAMVAGSVYGLALLVSGGRLEGKVGVSDTNVGITVFFVVMALLLVPTALRRTTWRAPDRTS